MTKPVDARDNGHTAKSYGNPLGIEWEACKRRALVPLDRLGILERNMRPLKDWPFKCSVCGSRGVALWLLDDLSALFCFPEDLWHWPGYQILHADLGQREVLE